MKFLTAFFGSLFISAQILLAAPSVSAAVDTSPDCDTVAIIRCGAFTEQALRQKAAEKDVPRVFQAFGIQQRELNGFVDGVVWQDGRVTVGRERVVANNAVTAGRWNNPAPDMMRIPNTDRAYKMSTKHFVDDGQIAFIKMVNGRFSFAVLKTCGNPVNATPVNKPEEPKNPDVNIVKDVRGLPDGDWTQSVSVRPGDRVQYRIVIRNTGDTIARDVRFNETLPAGITQIMRGGTITLNGKNITNDLRDGMSLGDLKVGERFVIIFDGQTQKGESRQHACRNGLVNVASVRADNVPEKKDDAVVKVCAPKVLPAVTTPTPVQPPEEPVGGKGPEILPDTGANILLIGSGFATTLGYFAYRWKLSRLTH